MSEIKTPTKCFYFGSFLFNKTKIEKNKLVEIWRTKLDDSLEFNHSFFPMKDYYSKEMGNAENLERFFLFSTDLRDREKLVEYKHWATDTENENLDEGNRIFNFDIGVLSLENLILATAKSYNHRQYIGRGIYGDLTLVFEENTYKPLPWSYPDYSHPEVINYFNFYRSILLNKLNSKQTR